MSMGLSLSPNYGILLDAESFQVLIMNTVVSGIRQGLRSNQEVEQSLPSPSPPPPSPPPLLPLPLLLPFPPPFLPYPLDLLLSLLRSLPVTKVSPSCPTWYARTPPTRGSLTWSPSPTKTLRQTSLRISGTFSCIGEPGLCVA